MNYTKKTWNVRWFLEDSATKVQYVKFKLWGQWDCKEILQVSNPRVSLMSLGSLFLVGERGHGPLRHLFSQEKSSWNFAIFLIYEQGSSSLLKLPLFTGISCRDVYDVKVFVHICTCLHPHLVHKNVYHKVSVRILVLCSFPRSEKKTFALKRGRWHSGNQSSRS